jgi:uncharacterized protein (DUF2147 family)
MRKLIFIVLCVLLKAIGVAQTEQTAEADKIVGLWEVGSGKARVLITKYGEKYGGRIVWLKEPNYPDGTKKIDKNNPDETKRTVSLLGLNNLLGFVYKGKAEYDGGTIYDPENGNTYNCVISLENENVLNVRGFIGVQLFGRTDSWKRVKVKAK